MNIINFGGMIRKLVIITLLVGGFSLIFIANYFRSFDLIATTSTQTISGLWNPQVLVSSVDIPVGATKICTGVNYVNVKVSEYDENELIEYSENGIMYNQPIINEEKIKPLSCTIIEIQDNMVLEGTNNDWGNVNYYIKFEDK
ncbi:hypothetical protein R2F61_08005 [Mollicutes bacterium LVI A0078]|nr:hypothetical protein RZE84_07780 [Mollicutes bacterium LVI A0075]WOO90658.1 hypothetical protein R2F61_08005 [Mollicutes bacterium LVI A0078]